MAKEKGLEKIKNLIGQQFGNLLVLSYVDIQEKQGSHWLCKCKCNKKIIVSYKNLTQGKTTSCGCANIKSKGEQKIAEILN